MPLVGREPLPDDANIQLLVAKLPADSMARKLVEPFAAQAPDEAVKAAQRVLAAAKAAHLKGEADDAADAT